MCVIFISFEANVRDKVRIVAIDCRGNNRSTVAYLENEIRVDQTIVGRERERKTQKRKLASILSISAIDHRRHCVWSFREERKKIITSAPFSLSLSRLSLIKMPTADIEISAHIIVLVCYYLHQTSVRKTR